MNFKLPLTISALLLASSAFAATDGTLDTASSTGTAVVKISITNAIQVSNLGDLVFTNTSASSTESDDICVYHRGNADYSITFTGANPDAANLFRMKNNNKFINYTVAYTDGKSAKNAVTHATAINASGAHISSANCENGTNGTIAVTTDETTLKAAPAGDYSDTLTVLVAPQ